MNTTVRTPSPAERAKTAVATSASVRLGILNLSHDVERHLVARDGSLVMQPAASSPTRVLALGGSVSPWVGTAIALDLASVPHADRLRARVTLTGPVESLPEPLAGQAREALARRSASARPLSGPVLRMAPTTVALEWLGAAPVRIPSDAYGTAPPDPFISCEAEWLVHLYRTHARALRALAGQVCAGLAGDADVRPLLVDRFGLVLRIYGRRSDRSTHDLRIAFPRAVACACEGADALNDLWRQAGIQQTSCHHGD